MLEFSLGYIFLIFAWTVAALWLAALFWTHYCLGKQQILPPAKEELPQTADQPFVSILLPARNEEKRILKTCVQSLLAQDYRNFEIIALNDRSTDGTGEVLGELAQKNVQKLRAVEGIELPEDWLGKPFALQQCLEKSNGEWILATDADIIFQPSGLRTTINYAVENNLDSLNLIPLSILVSFWERTFMPVFGWFCLLSMPPQRVNDPGRDESLGVGNFFLIKREVLEKIGEFEVVKNEVAEDLKLAEILKRKRFRIRTEYAPDLIQTRMYSSLSEIWEGFTKNFFAGSKFSLKKAISGAFFIFLYGALPPFLALVCFALWLSTQKIIFLHSFIPLFLIYILQILIFIKINRKWRGFPLYAVFAPLGLGLFSAILLNSTLKIISGRGVYWKGRAIYERGGIKPPKQVFENK